MLRQELGVQVLAELTLASDATSITEDAQNFVETTFVKKQLTVTATKS